MTSKDSIRAKIYNHLDEIKRATESGLPNGDLQGIMEAKAKTIYALSVALLASEAQELAMAVKERSDDSSLIYLADALMARITAK